MAGPGGRGGPGGPFGRYMTEEEKANQPKVTKALLGRVFSYLVPYTPQFLLALGCIALSSVFNLMPSLLTGKIIDEGLIGRDMHALVFYIVLSFSVTLGANLIGVAESYLNNWIAQHITFDMRNKMYTHLQQMSQSFFTTNNQGDIITRMTSDIDGVKSVIRPGMVRGRVTVTNARVGPAPMSLAASTSVQSIFSTLVYTDNIINGSRAYTMPMATAG